MTTSGATIINLFGRDAVRVVPWLGPLAMAVVALLLLWPRIRGKLGERRMRRSIERCGIDFVKDAMLPDGMDGMTHIDYLLLTPSGIVVADLKKYQGILFGAEHIDQWTQVLGQKSYKFANPMFKNELDVMAVRAQLPEVPVTGRVIFSGDGSFPKGRPAGVSVLSTLASDLGVAGSSRGARAEPTAELATAWQSLRKALADADRGERKRDGDGGSGILVASLLLLLACAWAGWMLHTMLSQ